MSDNGSGVFNVNSTGQPVVAATPISSSVFNAYTADAATAMSNRICKDGQTTVIANIPMGGYKFTGVGAGSARTDSANIGNAQDGTGVYVATVGGTADVITLTPSPAITAYVAGQMFRFLASGANTTNVTIAVSGLAAKALTKNGTTALAASDIPSGMMVDIAYDGTRFILGTTSSAVLNSPTLAGTPVFPDNVFTIGGSADATKKVAFEVDGLTTGTTRTLTVQDSNHVLVGRDTTDTLTNKTVTAPVLSGTVTGTYTLGGTPTLASPVLSGTATGTYTLASPVLSGTVTGTYTLGGTPTIPGTLTAGTPCVQNPYTTSTKTTQSHGRAVKPIYVDFYIECLSAEQNYGVGERLGANNFNTTSSAGSPLYSYDVNQVNILSPSGGLVALNGAAPSGGVALTAANWKVVATPYFLT